MFKGLQDLHDQHIVNADIKTDNMMMTKDRNLKFIDFGLATRRGKSVPDVLGTPYFNSPQKNNIMNIMEIHKQLKDRNRQF